MNSYNDTISWASPLLNHHYHSAQLYSPPAHSHCVTDRGRAMHAQCTARYYYTGCVHCRTQLLTRLYTAGSSHFCTHTASCFMRLGFFYSLYSHMLNVSYCIVSIKIIAGTSILNYWIWRKSANMYFFYGSRTVDRIAVGRRRKQRAPGWRWVCTYQMAVLFSVKWRLESLTSYQKFDSFNRCIFTWRTILPNFIPIQSKNNGTLG